MFEIPTYEGKLFRPLPSHLALQMTRRRGKPTIFTHIGAAWPSEDGKGFDLDMKTIPLHGTFILRAVSPI